ncbi:MAG: ATP-binding protein [candidate division WOR-3 bacterium]
MKPFFILLKPGGAIAALLVAFLTTAAVAGWLPYAADELWEKTCPFIVPVDTDTNSIDELLTGDSRNYVIARDQLMAVTSPSRSFDSLRCLTKSIGGCGQKLWAACVRNDSLILTKLWRNGELFVTSLHKSAGRPYWDGTVDDVLLRDIDGDSRIEAVVMVSAGFSRQPRGIYVLDWQTGACRWSYALGPNPYRLIAGDADNDGRTELILGTNAPANGNNANGTADSLCYVICLSDTGRLKWQNRIGEFGKAVVVAWLKSPLRQQPQLLVGELGHPVPGAEPDSLFLLEPATGSIAARAGYAGCNRQLRVAYTRRGNPLVVLGSWDDTLRLLDADLRLVKQQVMDGVACEDLLVGRFTGTGEDEIAVMTTNGRLLLYDLNLNKLAEATIGMGPQSRLAPVQNGNRHRLLIRLVVGSEFSWRLYDFCPVPRPFPWALLSAGLAVLLLIAGGVLVWQHRLLTKIRFVAMGLRQKAWLVDALQDAIHRLKSQLTSARMGIQQLARNPDPQAAREIAGEMEGLVQLANSIMRLTRDEPPKLELGDVNEALARIVEEYSSRLSPQLEIRSEFAPNLPGIWFDRTQLAWAIGHLLDNAVQAMPAGGRIVVRTEMASTDGCIAISVSDTGIGLKNVCQNKLFREYFTTKPTGTGVGLLSVRRVAEQHGGRVMAEDLPEGGARFTILLPVNRPAAPVSGGRNEEATRLCD